MEKLCRKKCLIIHYVDIGSIEPNSLLNFMAIEFCYFKWIFTVSKHFVSLAKKSLSIVLEFVSFSIHLYSNKNVGKQFIEHENKAEIHCKIA